MVKRKNLAISLIVLSCLSFLVMGHSGDSATLNPIASLMCHGEDKDSICQQSLEILDLQTTATGSINVALKDPVGESVILAELEQGGSASSFSITNLERTSSFLFLDYSNAGNFVLVSKNGTGVVQSVSKSDESVLTQGVDMAAGCNEAYLGSTHVICIERSSPQLTVLSKTPFVPLFLYELNYGPGFSLVDVFFEQTSEKLFLLFGTLEQQGSLGVWVWDNVKQEFSSETSLNIPNQPNYHIVGQPNGTFWLFAQADCTTGSSCFAITEFPLNEPFSSYFLQVPGTLKGISDVTLSGSNLIMYSGMSQITIDTTNTKVVTYTRLLVPDEVTCSLFPKFTGNTLALTCHSNIPLLNGTSIPVVLSVPEVGSPVSPQVFSWEYSRVFTMTFNRSLNFESASGGFDQPKRHSKITHLVLPTPNTAVSKGTTVKPLPQDYIVYPESYLRFKQITKSTPQEVSKDGISEINNTNCLFVGTPHSSVDGVDVVVAANSFNVTTSRDFGLSTSSNQVAIVCDSLFAWEVELSVEVTPEDSDLDNFITIPSDYASDLEDNVGSESVTDFGFLPNDLHQWNGLCFDGAMMRAF